MNEQIQTDRYAEYQKRLEEHNQQIKEALELFKSSDRKPLVFVLKEPRQNRLINGNTFKVKTFFEKEGNYFINKRKCATGYKEYQILGIGNIKTFYVDKEKEISPYDKALKVWERVKKIKHPNLWNNLTFEDIYKEYEFKSGKEYEVKKIVNIKNKFFSYVWDEVEKALSEKKDYVKWSYGTKRDIHIQIKVCDDGSLKAWYSSEFAGTGNGSYYLLLNKHYALFMEND